MQFHGRAYEVGANVRVSRGSLAGVAGVVIETRNLPQNCVVSIDFWAHGVLMALSGDDLEQIEMNRPRL
jgi:transcription antitermination factor NusG